MNTQNVYGEIPSTQIPPVPMPSPPPPPEPAAWGRAKPRKDLVLPSGARVLVEKIELTDLLSLGILDSVDSFTQKLLPDSSVPQEKKTEEDLADQVLGDMNRFSDIVKVVDKVVCRAVVQPRVHPMPTDEDGNEIPVQDDKIYAHLIPLEDRMAIFEEVLPEMSDTFPAGGGPAAGVEAVANVQELPNAPK